MSHSPRRRLDLELVRRALVGTRTEAQGAIAAGRVTVAGIPQPKAATLVDGSTSIRIVSAPDRFVSRGGEKLAGALEAFEVTIQGRRALDAGASTGGFTDCLLQGGAASVAAVDVGYGQLDWSIRTDSRVTVHERLNLQDFFRHSRYGSYQSFLNRFFSSRLHITGTNRGAANHHYSLISRRFLSPNITAK